MSRAKYVLGIVTACSCGAIAFVHYNAEQEKMVRWRRGAARHGVTGGAARRCARVPDQLGSSPSSLPCRAPQEMKKGPMRDRERERLRREWMRQQKREARERERGEARPP